jgi:hypothetical protein
MLKSQDILGNNTCLALTINVCARTLRRAEAKRVQRMRLIRLDRLLCGCNCFMGEKFFHVFTTINLYSISTYVNKLYFCS